MKKMMLLLLAVSSIFSATAFADVSEMESDSEYTVSLEQIEQFQDVVQAVKFENNDMVMWACPKGHVLATKRCWKNWRLVKCGYFCHKPPSPPCCHGEGKPQH